MQPRPVLEIASWIAGIVAAVVTVWALFKPSPTTSEPKPIATAPERVASEPISPTKPVSQQAPVPGQASTSYPSPKSLTVPSQVIEHSQSQAQDARPQAFSESAGTGTDPPKPPRSEVNLSSFDGDWESPAHRYGFDLRAGRGQATKSNSRSFAPGDTILKIERVANGRFYGEQMFSDGSWVKVTGRLISPNKLEMNGSGFTWVMEMQ